MSYIGRALGSTDVTNVDYFLIQIAGTVISPAFFSAGLYLTIGNLYYPIAFPSKQKSAVIVGKANSLLKPIYYVLIFSSIDVIALAIQSVGGGLASTAMNSGTDAATAGHITVHIFIHVSLVTIL